MRSRIFRPGIYFVLSATMAAFAAMSSPPVMAGNIPLPTGKFLSIFRGTITECLDSSLKPTACDKGAGGVLALPVHFLDTGTVTFDGKGNACSPNVEVDNPLPLNTALDSDLVNSLEAQPPTVVPNEHTSGKVADYNPKTGSGDMFWKTYISGEASCKGAILNPNGEKAFATYNTHFVVSDGGNRIDFLFTPPLTGPDGSKDYYGGVALTGFDLKQSSQNGQGQQ